MTKNNDAFQNGEAHDTAVPKIALKSARGAARVKRPPFGAPSRTALPAHPGSDTISMPDTDSEESSFAVWWRGTGRAIAAGIVISALWAVAFAVYITTTIGWGQLFTLLPDQFGSFMATFMLPLAFLWLVIAYLDRGRELRRESAALRYHCEQLTYLAEFAEERIATVSESLKAQARMLLDGSETAIKNMQKL